MTTINQSGDPLYDELSLREEVILQIAAAGESLAAIGAHEPVIDGLVARGFMTRLDKFNNVISPAGRRLMAQKDVDEDDAIARLINEMKAKYNLVEGAENPFFDRKAIKEV